MGDVDIIKSPLDKKEYKYIVLGNGLKVLLVSESKLVQGKDR
jgi:secreted Zn-dependent insulinase-like peptidase